MQFYFILAPLAKAFSLLQVMTLHIFILGKKMRYTHKDTLKNMQELTQVGFHF